MRKVLDIVLILLVIGLIAAIILLACCGASGRAADMEQIMQLEEQLQEAEEAKESAEATVKKYDTKIKILEFQLKAYSATNKELLNRLYDNQPSDPVREKKERLTEGKTNTLRFMDYRTITDKTSQQYKLQEVCDTNYDTGIRAYYIPETETDYYCVALGSAYGQDIGDTWEVTLQNGQRFNIILAECKDDGKVERFGDPDKNHDGYFCTNVIEFVTDQDYMPSSVISAGTYTVLGHFGGLYGNGGNIVKMEYRGRVWS